MSFEENFAKQLPIEHVEDEKVEKLEESEESDAELLIKLRKKQYEPGFVEYTDTERKLLVELQDKEEAAKNGLEPVSELERNRFLELLKQDKLNSSESEELAFLYDRIEGRK